MKILPARRTHDVFLTKFGPDGSVFSRRSCVSCGAEAEGSPKFCSKCGQRFA